MNINPLDKLPPILKKNLDQNLCTCNDVVKMDIINAIANGATTVEEIRKQTYATMGIGCCTQDVERLIEYLCSPDAKRQGLMMDKMVGKTLVISGMSIEVVSDDGERYETRNTTTKETIFFNKPVLQNAIKLGKAEEISPLDDKE